MSETYPFYSEEEDGMSKREQLEEYFSQSLEVDTLLRLCPDDEDTIYQIVDLLVDTCATNRKMLRIQKLKPIIRSAAAYAPPEVVDGKPPVYPYTPIKSDFEDAETVEEMMLYTELQSAVHAMIQRLEYSFTFNPSLLTSPKRKKQVAEILTEAEKYIWRIKEEMRCA